MARTKYAAHAQNYRRAGVMTRHDYLQGARANAPRGQDLPQTKLLALDVGEIRSAARQREKLRDYIRENLSNEALAKKFGVHTRTVEKCLSYETAGHIA